MSDTNHISKKEFEAFHYDTMNQKEKEAFLEHICSCDYCSDQFAMMMTDVMIEAPKDMKANILRATKRPEVQLAIKVKETSKRMQLFIYSLKVGTATVLALLLLMITMNTDNPINSVNIQNPIQKIMPEDFEDNVPLTAAIRNGMDAINNSIIDFSNNIMNTEVTDHD